MEPIKPEKALQILTDSGLQVSLEEAGIILEFLNNLANIAISVYLTRDDDNQTQ